MANQVPVRSAISSEFKWRLEDIYSDTEKWEADYRELQDSLKKADEFRGKLDTPDHVRELFELEDELSQVMEKLLTYARMKRDEDNQVTLYQGLTDRMTTLTSSLQTAFSYVEPELLSLSDEKWKDLESAPELKAYQRTLSEIARKRPHTLSASEESLVAQFQSVVGASGNTFRMLTNADLKFPEITDESGEKVQLSEGRYIRFMESKNREVRKEAFQTLFSTYRSYKNTLASTLATNVKENVLFARIRSFNSALEASLHGDNVPVEVYRNLIDAVHEKLPYLHQYMELRKRALGVDQLHMYDLFTPLVEYDMEVPYEKAKEQILHAMKPLGDRYLQVLTQAFESGWIDVYENEGKTTGAYSWGPYGVHPYVLMNYQSNLNSMFTLAHELGHALHSYFSDQKLSYREAQYPIFLAEVASTFNEALLMHDLLEHSKDENQRKYLLTNYLDDFRTTVFRQTMFAEFELKIHELEAEGQPLTADLLSEVYYDLNKIYYGPSMKIDDEIAIEWARIPHFYRSFYVYKYATGFSAATALSHQVLNEGASAVDRYFTFLSAGGSDFPIPILQRAGVDMSSKSAVTSCLDVFAATLDQASKLF